MNDGSAHEAQGRIRPVSVNDAGPIADIYNRHVTGTIVTFEEDPVPVGQMAARIEELSRRLPWLVCEQGGSVAGFAYASPWKTRSAYRFVAETSIYVADSQGGRGIGRQLYGALLSELRESGLCVALGCISLPNAASVALHERLGFVQVAEFPAVGWKFGRWVDVGYWQLRLRPDPSV